MLSKILAGAAAFFLIVAIIAMYQREVFRGQRDTARADLRAMTIAFETEVINTKTAVSAANQCKVEFDDRDARLRAALEAATAATDRARKAARACQSDDAVAARLGEVTQ